MKDYNNEVPKYKKKSQYHAKKRSDHKHIYKYVRLLVPFVNPFSQETVYRKGLGQVCEKCGYVHKLSILWSEGSKEDAIWEQCDEKAYICKLTDKFIELN